MQQIINYIAPSVKSTNKQSHYISYAEPSEHHKPAHQEGTTYYCNGYILPLDLVQSAHTIYKELQKKNKKSLFSLFNQIAYLCLTQDSRLCFKKQSLLGEGCKNIGRKALTRFQILRLEKRLIELGLYERSRHPNRKYSYDRALTPLGTVTYLLLSKKIYFFEKMSQRKPKNVTSQLLRHKRNILINTKPIKKISTPKAVSAKSDFIVNFEKVNDIQITKINNKHQFEVEFAGDRSKNIKKGEKALSDIRKLMDKEKGYEQLQQSRFREQAQRRVELTKQRIRSKGPEGFSAMQARALQKTQLLMRAMGILGYDNKPIKVSDEEAKSIFDIYYETYLNLEKKAGHSYREAKGLLNLGEYVPRGTNEETIP